MPARPAEPGFLGVAHRPFSPYGPGLENLHLPGGVSAVRMEDRKTLLASFSGGSDGDVLFGVLFARNEASSPKKTLYGTTSGLDSGAGTIFKLSDGTLTTLWNFTGGSDGAFPFYGLIIDPAGDLYGTT